MAAPRIIVSTDIFSSVGKFYPLEKLSLEYGIFYTKKQALCGEGYKKAPAQRYC